MVRNKSSSSSSSGNASNSSTKSPIRSHRKTSSSCSVALDDVKPSTSSSTRRSPNSSPDDDSDYEDVPMNTRSPFSSVHKQNLYVVSFPIIFLFNILRTLIYQLFCVFRYIYGASTKVIYRPHKRECNIEIVVGSSGTQSSSLVAVSSKDKHQLLEQSHTVTSTAIAPYPLPGRVRNTQQQLEMFNKNSAGIAPVGGSSPGPGDPLLAKQKHHHRRAFEYISKALKIDEENEGK